jgi:hypothetical protein
MPFEGFRCDRKGIALISIERYAWCGPGVDKPEVHNWIQTLDTIEKKTDEGAGLCIAVTAPRGDEN